MVTGGICGGNGSGSGGYILVRSGGGSGSEVGIVAGGEGGRWVDRRAE